MILRPSEMSPQELREYRWYLWSSTFMKLLPPLPAPLDISDEGVILCLAAIDKIADAVVELVLRKREEMLK